MLCLDTKMYLCYNTFNCKTLKYGYLQKTPFIERGFLFFYFLSLTFRA